MVGGPPYGGLFGPFPRTAWGLKFFRFRGRSPDEKEGRCVYSTITLFWTVVIGFVEHLRSRNQMDMARNSRALSQTVFECSGQRYDPDDAPLSWNLWGCVRNVRKKI